MMAGRFGGLAVSWSARCTSSYQSVKHSVIPVFVAVAVRQWVVGVVGLVKCGGQPTMARRTLEKSKGGRRQGSPTEVSPSCDNLDSPPPPTSY